MFLRVKTIAEEVLKESMLVHEMLLALQSNLDEECLHALGENAAVTGSKDKKIMRTNTVLQGITIYSRCQLLYFS